jgi:hypothetical protein
MRELVECIQSIHPPYDKILTESVKIIVIQPTESVKIIFVVNA